MVSLTNKQMEAICILADEKPHFFSDMVASLKMKESNFISDVLKPLQKNGFCIYGDPKKTRRAGRPPRPIKIRSYTRIGQLFRDKVIREVKLLRATETGTEGIYKFENSGNIYTVHGVVIDHPKKEINDLGMSLQYLIEWTEKRSEIDPNWRSSDGVRNVDEIISTARDELNKAKELFSKENKVIFTDSHFPIHVVIGASRKESID